METKPKPRLVEEVGGRIQAKVEHPPCSGGAVGGWVTVAQQTGPDRQHVPQLQWLFLDVVMALVDVDYKVHWLHRYGH